MIDDWHVVDVDVPSVVSFDEALKMCNCWCSTFSLTFHFLLSTSGRLLIFLSFLILLLYCVVDADAPSAVGFDDVLEAQNYWCRVCSLAFHCLMSTSGRLL